MQKKNLFTFLVIFFSFTILVTGCKEQPKTELRDVQTTHPRATLALEDTDYCPPISLIVKKQLLWGTSTGWHSISASFSDRIVAFLGAQWRGIENGRVICIYQGNEDAFPIDLQTNELVRRPPGDQWQLGSSQIKSGGIDTYNCISDAPGNCPFPKKPNIYKGFEIKSLPGRPLPD